MLFPMIEKMFIVPNNDTFHPVLLTFCIYFDCVMIAGGCMMTFLNIV